MHTSVHYITRMMMMMMMMVVVVVIMMTMSMMMITTMMMMMTMTMTNTMVMTTTMTMMMMMMVMMMTTTMMMMMTMMIPNSIARDEYMTLAANASVVREAVLLFVEAHVVPLNHTYTRQTYLRFQRSYASITPNPPTNIVPTNIHKLSGKIPRKSLWALEFHPLRLRLCQSPTL